MIAFQERGIPIEEYHAYEVDKYAIQTSSHNFPKIIHHGDVFKGDFTKYKGFDYLIGGSPCQHWSVAQKKNRETEASGIGWELFSQYVRALKEAQPKYFLYENNKSMSNAIKASITEVFGFEPICINSALVSAQNRQRLYWVGRRNKDGTYSKVKIEQPEDRGILLKDILEDGLAERDKGYCLKHQAGNARDYFKKHHTNIKFEPVNFTDGNKSQTIKSQYYKNSIANFCCYSSTYGATGVAEPIRVGSLPRPNGEPSQSQAFRIYDINGKSVNITSGGGGAGGKTGLYAVPCAMRHERDETAKALRKDYEAGKCKHGFNEHRELHPRQDGKSNTVTTVLKDNPICEHAYYPYAIPCEWDDNNQPIKAISFADGKTYQVYEVKRGFITIKCKEYPIKLDDGFYIIRKLTVTECMRLQTVPEWYKFPVSDTQAYKMLGNGWCVNCIVYLLSHTIS